MGKWLKTTEIKSLRLAIRQLTELVIELRSQNALLTAALFDSLKTEVNDASSEYVQALRQ